MKRKKKPTQPRILTAEVNYTQRLITGFDNRGLATYIDVTRTHVVYACSHDELKKNIKSFQASIPGMSQYQCHRHPRAYIEVLP